MLYKSEIKTRFQHDYEQRYRGCIDGVSFEFTAEERYYNRQAKKQKKRRCNPSGFGAGFKFDCEIYQAKIGYEQRQQTNTQAPNHSHIFVHNSLSTPRLGLLFLAKSHQQ